MASFGERLKEERKRRHLTQSEMSELLEMTRSSYSLYESDRREPNILTLRKIATILNVDMDFLIGRSNFQKVNNEPNNLSAYNAELYGHKEQESRKNSKKATEASYEKYCKIRNSKGFEDSQVAAGTGIGKSTFSDWKSGRYQPKAENLNKIADFLGVPFDYFTNPDFFTVSEICCPQPILTAKDERDITKDVESIMAKLVAKESGPASYDGEELSEESAALFRDELEIALRRLKLINKEKYNPYKNKARVAKKEDHLVPLAAHANPNATVEDQEADIALIKRRKAILDEEEE